MSGCWDHKNLPHVETLMGKNHTKCNGTALVMPAFEHKHLQEINISIQIQLYPLQFCHPNQQKFEKATHPTWRSPKSHRVSHPNWTSAPKNLSIWSFQGIVFPTNQGVFSGTPKDMGPLYGKWDPYYSNWKKNSKKNQSVCVVFFENSWEFFEWRNFWRRSVRLPALWSRERVVVDVVFFWWNCSTLIRAWGWLYGK